MKKHFFIIYLLAFFLTACQKTQDFTIETPSEFPTLHIFTENEKEIEKEDYVPAQYVFQKMRRQKKLCGKPTAR